MQRLHNASRCVMLVPIFTQARHTVIGQRMRPITAHWPITAALDLVALRAMFTKHFAVAWKSLKSVKITQELTLCCVVWCWKPGIIQRTNWPWRDASSAGPLVNCGMSLEWWLGSHSSRPASSVSAAACQSEAYCASRSLSVNCLTDTVLASVWTGAAGSNWTEWLKLSVVARDDPEVDDFKLSDWNRLFDASI